MKNKKQRFIIVFLLSVASLTIALYSNALATESSGASSNESNISSTLPATLVKKLDSFLQAQVYLTGSKPQNTAPGIILLVDSPAGRYLRAEGLASLEQKTPITPHDIVEIGSNTKSFTTVLLLKLQEAGKLSLDDSLKKWLPQEAELIPYGKDMTLRQLAQHTSGIWDYADDLIGSGLTQPDKLTKKYSPAELVHYAIEKGTPDFRPGEEGKWKYSNTSYILLGMILEKVTGMELGQLYKQYIFDPLHLKSARFVMSTPDKGSVINGYWVAENGEWVNTIGWNLSQGWAAGAIIMNVDDLLTYAKSLASGLLFNDTDSLQQMLTFDENGMGGIAPYGLGVMSFSKLSAPGFWGHAGQTAGFQTLWCINPESETTVIGLSNSASYHAYAFLNAVALIIDELK